MELVPLAVSKLTYRSLELIDYEHGGQAYGSMDGTLSGDRLSGRLHVTNLAARREDGVNLPTLRGLLTTDDGARIWVEMDGVATRRESDGARLVVTAVRFRTGDARYGWLNTLLAVQEGVLGKDGDDLVARGTLSECRPTVA